MDLQNIITNFIPGLWEKHSPLILDIGRRLLIAVLIIVSGKIATAVSRHLTHRAVTGKLKADETIVSILRAAIHYGVIIICAIMLLDTFGVNTTSLIALLGAAGVAVGFALKDTLSNIAAGIIILFLRPFRKGDFIECNSVLGAVRDLGLFAATLETADGVNITVPNSCLWGFPLKNYSRNPTRRLDITIAISYSDSIDSAFAALRNIINEEVRFLKDPAPQVMVQSLAESGIGITLRAWVAGADYWAVYWDQMKIVKERIQNAGLNIGLPHRNIRLVKDSGDTREGVSGGNFDSVETRLKFSSGS